MLASGRAGEGSGGRSSALPLSFLSQRCLGVRFSTVVVPSDLHIGAQVRAQFLLGMPHRARGQGPCWEREDPPQAPGSGLGADRGPLADRGAGAGPFLPPSSMAWSYALHGEPLPSRQRQEQRTEMERQGGRREGRSRANRNQLNKQEERPGLKARRGLFFQNERPREVLGPGPALIPV